MQFVYTLMRKAYSISTVVHTLMRELDMLMSEAISSFTIVHTLITEAYMLMRELHTLMRVVIC